MLISVIMTGLRRARLRTSDEELVRSCMINLKAIQYFFVRSKFIPITNKETI